MSDVMPTYKVIVQAGRIVIDNLDYADGTELELEIVQGADSEEEALLDAELDASVQDIEAGRTYPAEEVFAELLAER